MSDREWPSENLRREWEWFAHMPPCPVMLTAARVSLGLAVALVVADELIGGVPLGWFAALLVIAGSALAYRAYHRKE